MTYEIITLIANVALTLSFIIALIFGVAQIETTSRERRDRLTLDTVRNFQTREFSELIFYITNHNMPVNEQQMKALPAKDQVMLIQFGQQMESLGILVAEKYIDIDLVVITLGSFVTNSWEKYKLLFLDIRQKTPDPFLGEYYQWLAEQIDKRMNLSPRKPFHESGRSL